MIKSAVTAQNIACKVVSVVLSLLSSSSSVAMACLSGGGEQDRRELYFGRCEFQGCPSMPPDEHGVRHRVLAIPYRYFVPTLSSVRRMAEFPGLDLSIGLEVSSAQHPGLKLPQPWLDDWPSRDCAENGGGDGQPHDPAKARSLELFGFATLSRQPILHESTRRMGIAVDDAENIGSATIAGSRTLQLAAYHRHS